ncbi:caspase family protein [Streptomyces sp. 5-8]|uniref:Caspase family protein n=1 Tax=Streptomyces musisoli TaxID=2802280 RepID=A0ABS1P614_9ACTN|nr:caspase family protein [Streptomyces musisoli]MBL1107527.1 caspase family protein [Streptomyces musisoli]
MTATRIALLIGVGSTPDAGHRFVPLDDPVRADQRLLAASLTASGYTVETLYDATRAEIVTRIDEVSRGVPADGTLLLHFSGHGLRIGAADYLVPADARAPHDGDGWRPSYLQSLLPADISPYLADCPARTVLWLIDACRDQPADATAVFGSSILRGQPEGRFAVLTAGRAGQRAGYTAEGSFFTTALAEAFGPMTVARTVHEVYDTARRHAMRSARRLLGEQQEPQVYYCGELGDEARATVVCEGRRLLEAWREAVADTALWDRVPPAEAGCVPRLKEALTRLVEGCAVTVHRVQERMADPWADDDFPVRLLRDRLPDLLPKTVPLSALEAAALVAAPFLHEAAWAGRFGHAAEISAYSVGRQEDADAWRRHYEQVAAHHPHLARKVTRCMEDDRLDDAHGVALWLVHRWIAELFETAEEPVPPAGSRGLAAAFLGRDESEDRTAELARALCAVAAGVCLGGPAADGQDLEFPVPGGGRQPLRSAELAALLHLASCLALDARRLPEVFAEHLAVFDPVLPQEAVHAARAVHWHAADGELHLDAACRHPALHAALAQVAEHADELARDLRESARRLPPPRSVLLSGVPSRVTDRGLRPVEERGRRAYDVPLLRFQLAQTEVRELLMGERLYDGEPGLALRELYQNAMDACRYRAMRRSYLEARGGRPGPWTGRITIIEGEDERGRYVECRDNGVGMGLEQLRNTFTMAGRRFEQSRAFRKEQADWHRQDPSLRLYPNSRFGIGVFSYFMLAEEMTVVTRPVGVDGIPGPKALRVEIPGSANLFRIQVHEDAGDSLLEGGTRIRLYLRDSVLRAGLSAPATLRRLVLVSEFELEVRDGSGRGHHWEPGLLQYTSEDGGNAFTEGVPGVLWWVDGQGAVLCDGIATDRQPFGYVLNLTGPRAGELSLNRKQLKVYDRAWERDQWARGAAVLAAWPGLSMPWLWELERESLATARVLWEQWRGKGITVRRAPGDPAVELDAVGWFYMDQNDWFLPDPVPEGRREFTTPWRNAALRGDPPPPSEDPPPASLAGYPVPAPGWSDVVAGRPKRWGSSSWTYQDRPDDWRCTVALAHGLDTTVADILRTQRALRLAHPCLSPPPTREGDLDWAPERLDVEIMEALLSRPATSRGQRRFGGRNDYVHSVDDLGGIVRTTDSEWTLGQLVEACAKYRPFLAAPVPSVPPHHRDHVCDADDLTLLYVGAEQSRWRPTRQPWDVLEAAERLGIVPAEAVDRLARFAWLGWTAPDADLVGRWATAPQEVLDVLSEFCLPDATGALTVPWAATLALAALRAIPLTDAERELARWSDSLGLTYRRRYEGASNGRLVPGLATAALVRSAHVAGLALERGLGLRDLAHARPRGGLDHMSYEQLSDVAEELREAGVDIPAVAGELLRAWDVMPTPGRAAFSAAEPYWPETDYPVLPTSDMLFMSTVHLKTPLAAGWEIARREARRFGLTVPRLPAGLRDVRPTREAGTALLDWGVDDGGDWFESPRWTPLTGEALAVYARSQRSGPRAAYESLARFRELGALVPELSPRDVADLPAGVPGPADVLALGAEHRVSGPGEPLCPLDLVGLAGRLGEPADRTWRRIAPYLPFEPPPDLPSGAVPAVLPLWQDLILLSREADGALPALQGRVEAGHIRFAAHAVGESEDWVRQRLALYAGLFRLEL